MKQIISREIKTPEGEGLDIEVTLQKPDTKEEIDQFYTSNGNYSRSVKSGTYDVVLDINNSQMVISLQDVPHEELNDPLDMDPFIPNAYRDVPISSNDNELTGVAIKRNHFRTILQPSVLATADILTRLRT